MPYIDHRAAQNVARKIRGAAPLPPHSRWEVLVPVVGSIAWLVLFSWMAWELGKWHGHTQRDIAAQYSETK